MDTVYHACFWFVLCCGAAVVLSGALALCIWAVSSGIHRAAERLVGAQTISPHLKDTFTPADGNRRCQSDTLSVQAPPKTGIPACTVCGQPISTPPIRSTSSESGVLVVFKCCDAETAVPMSAELSRHLFAINH